MAYEALADIYDANMRDVNYTKWVDYIADLLDERGINRGAHVIDCGCGTGTGTVLLKKHGFDVCGADKSPQMLNIAAENARNAGQRIQFLNMDMRKLTLHRPVSAVISMCDGVNYLADITSLNEFFCAAHSSLIDGGVLAFDVSSKYKLEHILGDNTFTEVNDNDAYIWENQYDTASRLLTLDITVFIKKGNMFEKRAETQIQRAHDVGEIVFALENNGFINIKVFEAFSKILYSETNERIQFIAQRGK
ncbi:MAG: class I SAM-dependent methyltransferase [Clostridia bacterium]